MQSPFRHLAPSRFLRPCAVLGDSRMSQPHMVGEMRVSRDGRWLVTDTGGRNPERLYVWKLATGRLRWSLPAGIGTALYAFHPDGEHLIVRDPSESTLWLYALATGRRTGQLTLQDEEGDLSQLHSSEDGTRLLVGHRRVFDVGTGRLLGCADSFEDSFFPSYLSPQGRYVVSCRGDHRVALFDVDTGQTAEVDAAGEYIYGYGMSRDERLLVIRGFESGEIYQVSPEGQVELLVEDGSWMDLGDRMFPAAMALSPDGSRLALSRNADTVEIYALPSLEREQTLPVDRCHALAFLPDGERLVAARYGDIVNYYDSASLEIWHLREARRAPLRGRQGHSASVLSLAAPRLPHARDRGLLCSTGVDDTVRVWSAEELREIEVVSLDRSRPDHVSADDAFDTLFVGWSSDMAAAPIALDTRTLAPRQTFQPLAVCSRLSPDGRSVAQLDYSMGLHLYDARNGELLTSFTTAGRAYRLSWSPDSRYLLAHGERLTVYDREQQVEERTGEDQIYAAAMLSEDRYVWIDAGGLHLARVGEDELRTKAGTWFNYYHHHALVAASHDGAVLAVSDGKCIWRFELATLTRRGIVRWRRPPGFRLLSLCFSRDDSRLFAGTSTGPILAFDLTEREVPCSTPS